HPASGTRSSTKYGCDIQRAGSNARKRREADGILVHRVDLWRTGNISDAGTRALPGADILVRRLEARCGGHDPGLLRGLWIPGLYLSFCFDSWRAVHARPRLRLLSISERRSDAAARA